MSRKITIFNAISIVYLFSAANFILSILLQLFLAYLFGIKVYMDAYLVAMNIPMVITSLILSFEAVFVPIFKQYDLEKGKNNFDNLINSIFSLLAVVLTLVSISGFIFAHKLIFIFAPGFSTEIKDLAVTLFRIMIPSVVFSGLSAFLVSIYHSEEKFILPAIVSISNIFALIIMTFFFHAHIGILSVAWGVLLGSMLQLFILMPRFLLERHYRLMIKIRYSELGPIIKKLLCLTVGGAFLGLILIFEKFLASGLPVGSISILGYAGKMISIVLFLPSIAIPTVLLPQLSACHTLKDLDKLRSLLSKGIRVTILCVLPTTVLLLIFRLPLIKLLLERGAFDVSATNNTAMALVCYIGVFIAMGLSSVINIGFLAIQEVVIPALLMIAAFFFYALAALILSKLFLTNGLALAFSLTGIVSIIAELVILRKKLNGIDGRNLLNSFLRISFASLAMGIVIVLIFRIMPPGFSMAGQKVWLAARVGIASLFGLLVFNIACLLLGVGELNLVYETIYLRFRKGIKSHVNFGNI